MTDDKGFVTDCTTLTQYLGNDAIVYIPEGIVKINDFAFWSNNNITTIIIPESVKKIGESAFCNCAKLENVTINGNGSIIIGAYAFAYCINLTGFNNCRETCKIGEYTFMKCTLLEKIYFRYIRKIPDFAFQDCENLVSVTIPERTKTGYHSFYGCSPDLKMFRYEYYSK